MVRKSDQLYSSMHKWHKKVVAWITLVFFLVQPSIGFAEVVADPNAAGQKKPMIENTANGIPIVQIATPIASGISHNLYQVFNVDPNGLILNNSYNVSQTQLAGYVAGNPFLAGGSARVILNEITSTNPTYLKGFTEVAGQRAEVIIANPNGIIGNGFGFINASRAVLTTGTPIFGGSGSLEAFKVIGGNIAIEGDGMNSSTIDQVDFISRAVKINAGLWAQKLNLITGANQVDYNTLSAQVVSGDSNQPQVAVDVGMLGGMYAKKIYMVGTENGVGVNSQGMISANGGDITITSAGKIVLDNSTTASGNIQLSAQGDITNSNTLYAQESTYISATGDMQNTGTLASGKHMTLSIQNYNSSGITGAGIKNDGTLANGGDLTINAAGTIDLHGQKNLAAGNMTVTGTTLNLANSVNYAGGSASLTATLGNIDHSAAQFQAGDNLQLKAQQGTILNDHGTIKADQISFEAAAISNRTGTLIQFGQGTTELIASGNIDNTGGTLATNGDNVNIHSGTLTNNQGQIQHVGTETLFIKTSGRLDNESGAILSNGQLDADAQEINNNKGTVKTQGNTKINSQGVLNNSQGIIAGNSNINISSQNKIDNSGGFIEAGKGLDATASLLDNNGGNIKSLDNTGLNVSVNTKIDNTAGFIGANGAINLIAKTLINKNGQISAQGDITASIDQDIDNNGGRFVTNQDLIIQNAENVTGGGAATARDIHIAVSNNLYTGDFHANRDMRLFAKNVNSQGTSEAVNNLSVNASAVDNSTQATLQAGNALAIKGTNQIVSKGAFKGHTINLEGESIDNTGVIFADNLTLISNTITNTGDQAVISGSQNVNLYARTSLENKDGATIYSMGDIQIAGSANQVDGQYTDRTENVLNQSAKIEAEQNINIYTGQLTNKKSQFQVEKYVSSSIPRYIRYSGNHYRTYTEYVTEERITADSTPGKILAANNINITGAIQNDYSTIAAGNNLSHIGKYEAKDYQRITTTTKDGSDVYTHEEEHCKGWFFCWDETVVDATPKYFEEQKVNVTNGSVYSTFTAGNQLTIQGPSIGNGSINLQAPIGQSSSTTPGGLAHLNQASKNTGEPSLNTPNGGMFKTNLNPNAAFLIETDPRFTDFRTFMSSDYMLQRLSSHPEKVMKRLGDGFYEQKLVRDQILELTGRYYLNGYTSSETEFKALMDNGIAQAQAFHLQVGIALTAEQINQLTSDIVWMVEKEVKGQSVLVPIVYLSKNESINLRPDGSLIAAKDVQITTADSITNTGTIKADNTLLIKGDNVVNYGGKMESGNMITVAAVNDIANQSGTIKGKTVNVIGRDVTSETVISTAKVGELTIDKANQKAGIEATDNLNIQATRDLQIQGTDVRAGKDMNLTAGHDLSIGTAEQRATATIGDVYKRDDLTQVASTLQAGNNMNINAVGDTNLQGVIAAADNKITISGANVTVKAAKDHSLLDVRLGDKEGSYYNHSLDNHETVFGSLAAKGDITLKAQETGANNGNITIIGNGITSVSGKVDIHASNNVTIKEETEKHETLRELRQTSRGFLSKTVTDTMDYSMVNQVKGTNISGEEINIISGNHLTVQGSNVVGTHDVNLTAADGNADIISAQEKTAAEHYQYEKTTGLFGSGGFGFTIGSKSQEYDATEKGVNQVGSVVGSNQGKVTITAGKDANVIASDVIGHTGIDVTAENIHIASADNTADKRETFEAKQSGLTVSVGGGVIGAISDAVSYAKRSEQVSDKRLKALYEYKTIKALEKANDASKILKDPKADPKDKAANDISLSIGFGSSQQKAETNTHATSVVGSRILSDGDIHLKATGTGAKDTQGKAADGDIHVEASQINAENIVVEAARNINITSTTNTMSSASETSGSSSGIGVTIGIGANNPGIGIFANASKQNGNADENNRSHQQAEVAAQHRLEVISGKDLDIQGGQLKGDTVKINVGGNMKLESRQDTESYIEQNQSTGGVVDVGLNGKISASISASRDNINSNYQSVNQQTGVYAGSGGFDITVSGNTNLKGAVISSDAMPDKNKLTTGTLTYSDIQNKADYSSSSTGIGLGTNKDGKLTGSPTPSIPVGGKAESTTKSGISQGTIEIRNNPNQDISNLSRTPEGALNALGKIFDKKSVEEQKELVNLFSQEANKAIGDLAESMIKNAKTDEEKAKWKEGGEYKVLLHAVAGGLTSSLAGYDFASGAVGDGISQLAQKQLANITDKNLRLIASAAVGAAAAKLVGGNGQIGASVAFNGTKYNDYNHRTHRVGEIVWAKSADDGQFHWFQVGSDGQDHYMENPPPAGAYVWIQDDEHPDLGWDYKKGDGVTTKDTYFSGKVIDQYIFGQINGHAVGVSVTDYTDAQKHEILVDAGKRWADAQLAALSGGGTFGGLGAALEAGTAARTLMTEQILCIPKGARPDPTTYLPQSFVDSHLASFEGGVTKLYANAPTGNAGPPGGTFVMPKAVADDLIAKSGGDIAKLESSLGLTPGTLGTNPVRVDVSSPSGLRMPSGNEIGANSQWRPGGFTTGGIPEATINSPAPSEYTVTSIFR